MRLMMNWIKTIKKMYELVASSSFENFAYDLTEFIMIFVSCPVKTTSP